ncbi:hypothetical protein [Thiohalomonas denitrificans]|uniref:hypothetical protein n=1 Tax=Thiohalomonas denitrificans TaxID=415747 RepID=UPI000B865586|nr:hypothetical protein [Thiohalomonas denitrificans]
MSGATVCLDTNRNQKCDSDEPTAQTGAGGTFSLDVPDDIDANAYSIVVDVVAGTIDEDTGQPIVNPYILSAPAGKPGFVSPLTTAVQAAIERNPVLTSEEAEAQVKGQIGAGSDTSLFEDYVAAKKDTSNESAADYERLHKVAQVTAKVMAENQDAITTAASDAGLDIEQVYQDLLALVLDAVLDQLDESAQVVDDSGDSFDIDTTEVTVADTTNIEEDLEEAANATSFTAVPVETVLASKANWVWSEREEWDGVSYDYYEYGEVGFDSETGNLAETLWEYNADTNAWENWTEDGIRLILTSNGWEHFSDNVSAWSVTFNDDGSASVSLGSNADNLKLTAAQLDVSGKKMQSFMQGKETGLFGTKVPADAVFADDSIAYRVNWIANEDSYELDSWTDCDDPSVYNGNCNVLWGHSTSGPATSFEELIFPDETTADSSYHYAHIGDELGARFIDDGRVQITDAANGNEVSYGSWSYQTVHGTKLMMVNVPDRFSSRLWEDEGQLFLAVQDGYVRQGEFTAAGEIAFDDDYWFNETAMDSLLSQFNFSL